MEERSTKGESGREGEREGGGERDRQTDRDRGGRKVHRSDLCTLAKIALTNGKKRRKKDNNNKESKKKKSVCVFDLPARQWVEGIMVYGITSESASETRWLFLP